MSPVMLAVSGGSGSGKSSFVSALAQAATIPLVEIEMDQYYFDLSHLSPSDRAQVNFDHPKSIEWELLHTHLRQLKAGYSIERPCYDFKDHVRTGTQNIHAGPVIVLDGIFALHDPRIFDVIDLRIFIECDDDVRLARRLIRDAEERGRNPKQVVEQYLASVKPMHAQFIEPTKYRADLIIPWQDRNYRGVQQVSHLINKLAELAAF